jgi:glycosyltransferase involved in cell wall biosynthesis
LPKGLTEAGACGCALITTDVPGCREVVTDEVDGLLVPVKDSTAVADAILRLANDADLRWRLGDAARKKAVAQFDERIVIDKTLEVYQELISSFRDVP